MGHSAIVLGAVAYDPKVVTIWDGFQMYFGRHGLDFDYILYTTYERQVEALLAGTIDVAWNSPLAWLQAERIAIRLGQRAKAICMRDTDRDLASVIVHENLADFWSSVGSTRVFAFTSRARSLYTDVAYRPSDVLLFGTERTGLPADVLADRRITQAVRIPMLPGRRSLNLSNAASIAAYEAWRQIGFAGATGAPQG